MKKKLNLKQIADAYCLELGVNVPQMENYLYAVFNDLPYKELEAEIVSTLKEEYDGKSEYFPEYN
jgi:hypothetical protein